MMIVPKKEQLKDPNVMTWVAKRWAQANRGSDPDAAACFSRLVDAEIVDYWMESGNAELAGRIVAELPSEAVERLEACLALPREGSCCTGWARLPAPVRARLLVRMAEVVPHRALPLLEEAAENLDPCMDRELLLATVQAASTMGPWALDVLETLARRIEGRFAWVRMLDSGLIQAATRLRMPGLAHLVVRACSQLSEGEELEIVSILDEVYDALAPNTPYLRLVVEMGLQFHGYLLSDLPELFEEDAPLTEMDRLVSLGNWSRLESALKLLRTDGPFPELAFLARELAREVPASMSDDAKRLFFLFVLGSAAAQYSRTEWAFRTDDLRYLLDLFTVDVKHLPAGKALEDAILSILRHQDHPLLVEELEDAGAYRGAARLIRLMDKVGNPAFVQPLLDCLVNVADADAGPAAVQALGRFGTVAVAAVRGRWPVLEGFQRVQALDVLAAAGTPESGKYLAELFPDVVRDEAEFMAWCAAAERMPHRRLVKLLEKEGGPYPTAARSHATLKALLAA